VPRSGFGATSKTRQHETAAHHRSHRAAASYSSIAGRFVRVYRSLRRDDSHTSCGPPPAQRQCHTGHRLTRKLLHRESITESKKLTFSHSNHRKPCTLVQNINNPPFCSPRLVPWPGLSTPAAECTAAAARLALYPAPPPSLVRSTPRFLAECCKRQLDRGSFVLLYFGLFTFADLY